LNQRPVRITYIGHSTVLVEIDGLRVLTDPILVDRVGPLLRHAPKADLSLVRRIDVVLLSHLHADHFNAASFRQIDPNATLVAPYGSAQYLRGRVPQSVIEINPGESRDIGGVILRATDAQHDSTGQPLGVRSQTLGYVIDGEQSVYFAGDTDIFPGMAAIPDDADGVLDIALLPISGWGLRVPKGHLTPQRAAEALQLLHPAHAVPIHWGSLRLAGIHNIQRWRSPDPAGQFVMCARETAPNVDVRIVQPGAATTFP
jgi:L-ascorbate metabolism protein UlaG (beta-lactamase superfamily)